MIAPPARVHGALAVCTALAALALGAMRVQPAVLRFPPSEPPRTGVPIWRVHLNSAPAAELRLLPGVGPHLAERIVQFREVHGPFDGPQALDAVPGIGTSVIQRLAPHVR